MREIDSYNATNKPGWVRLSLHPTMSNEESLYCVDSIRQIAAHGVEWAKGFEYNPKTNEFDKIIEEKLSSYDVEHLLFAFGDSQ